jgi:transcription antitermination factor NusG
MPENETFQLRGSMNTLVDGAAHLSEHGEALQQFSRNEEEDNRGSVQSETSLAHWYALHTYPRHEKRVYEYLGLRAIECFLPLYETEHRWKNGCKARVELPLFPGYLFVRIDPRERFKALSLPGALSMVGSGSSPWPLPDAEIASLRERLQSRKFEPHPYLAVGQKVRIKTGPLADLTGFLVRQSGGLRVVIAVDLIRQAAAVEVDAGDVEPIGPAPTGIDA